MPAEESRGMRFHALAPFALALGVLWALSGALIVVKLL
jgi:hypothetical protein